MDLNFDLSPEGRSRAEVRAAHIEVTPEEREQLGPLVALRHNLSDREGRDLIDEIFIHIAGSLHDKTDPLRGVKALCEARTALRLLVKKGYPHGAHLQVIRDGVDQARRLLLRETIRRLLRGGVSEAQTEITIELLNDEAALGWDVIGVIDSCEAELIAAAPARPA